MIPLESLAATIGIPMCPALSVVGKALKGQQGFEPQKVATLEDIRRALQTAASAPERDCAAILRGDLSIWPGLRRIACEQSSAGN
jgi:hypothetical protein